MNDECSSSKRPRLGSKSADGQSELDEFLLWLRAQGAVIDGLEFRDDGQNGIGVFTTKSILAGDIIARIPQQIVLTSTVARESPLGQALTVAGASDELIMWSYMVQGRATPSHPWHPYLSSLPAEQPDPTAWPPEAMRALRGTPLFQMVVDAKAMVERELQSVFERLKAPVDESVTWLEHTQNLLSLDRVLWARGIFLSRCFPAELGKKTPVTFKPDVGHVDSNDVGCLLPFFDLLNHKTGQPIVWESSVDHVDFKTVTALSPGEEVFNNYGAGKSNEQLMFFYGFAEVDRTFAFDVVTGMVLACDFEDGSEAAMQLPAKHQRLLGERVPCGLMGPGETTLRLGPFEIKSRSLSHVRDDGVLPSSLLFALGVAVAEKSSDEIDINALPADAFALLHGTLVAALTEAHAAPPPPPEPAGRAASIVAYREGRLRLLSVALREVEKRLEEFASDEED